MLAHPAKQAPVPIAPRGETKRPEQISKRKGPKSHNGCITCKSKRMKCDETKPACRQCSRRKITCGGYAKSLRWKEMGQPKGLSGRLGATLLQTDDLGDPSSSEGSMLSEDHGGTSEVNVIEVSPFPPRTFGTIELAQADEPTSSVSTTHQTAPVEVPESPKDTSVDRGYCFDLEDFDAFLQNHLGAEVEDVFHDHQWLQLHDTPLSDLDGRLISQDLFERESSRPRSPSNLSSGAQEEQEMDMPREISHGSQSTLGTPADKHHIYTLYRQPQIANNSPETIFVLFQNETSKILSIKEDLTTNPWRTLIWPLAKDCPPLYHAIAAMTCLHLGRVQPQLREQGIKHFKHSVEALKSTNHTDMTLEAALATNLALGFAEEWDHQKSSTGTDHIKGAKILLQKAFAKDRTPELPIGQLSRLTFLANTWTYMDVIARFTSTSSDAIIDFDFMTSCSQLSPVPPDLQIDPLMGCAVTLFPTIGRVADLVSRIRRRTTKQNSLTVISKALELKLALEHWIPPLNPEKSKNSALILDSIQTAEAYRWATLLLLRQAVPELPNILSQWESAQKVMVFLATVSLTSNTRNVQIFPLMAAGCEATEEEDREWVAQRWALMSRYMVTGIVERCQQVTKEVWKRRDEYEARRRSLSGTPLSSEWAQDASMAANVPEILQHALGASNFDGSTEGRLSLSPPARSAVADFPISIALKNNVDFVTSSGNADFSVRGNLHWLAVMEDWKWEGE